MKGENYAVVSRGDDGGSCSKGESPGGHPLYERRRFAWDPLRNPQNQTPALGKEMSNHRRAGRTAPRRSRRASPPGRDMTASLCRQSRTDAC